jgi:hypothetical protein
MTTDLLLPNLEGIPSCSEVEPKWARVFREGYSSLSQVTLDDMVLAELQSGQVFLGDTLMPLVREILIKNPYNQAPKKQFGIMNGIAKLDNTLIVLGKIGGSDDLWQVRRAVNWDNLTHPGDMHLLKTSFARFLDPLDSVPTEV